MAVATAAIPFLKSTTSPPGSASRDLTENLGWRVDFQAAIGTRAGVAHGVTGGLRYQF